MLNFTTLRRSGDRRGIGGVFITLWRRFLFKLLRPYFARLVDALEGVEASANAASEASANAARKIAADIAREVATDAAVRVTREAAVNAAMEAKINAAARSDDAVQQQKMKEIEVLRQEIAALRLLIDGTSKDQMAVSHRLASLEDKLAVK